jgi:hypothetical protein
MAAGQRGDASVDEVMRVFRDWPLIVPSAADFSTDTEDFRPLVYDRDGVPMMALFTSPDRLRTIAEFAPFWTTLAGSAVLSGAAPGTGFVVNPGSRLGMELDPPTVARFAIEAASAVEGEDAPRDFGRELTVLERAVVDLASRRTERGDFLAVLAESDIVVPSATPPDIDADDRANLDGISPAVVDSGGVRHIAVYTHDELIREDVLDGSTYLLSLAATGFARAVLGEIGLMIDPGTAFEVTVTPGEVALLAR